MLVKPERLDGERLAATNRGRHGFSGHAEHVGVRIAKALVQPRSADVQVHPVGVGVGGSERLDRTSPDHARRT